MQSDADRPVASDTQPPLTVCNLRDVTKWDFSCKNVNQASESAAPVKTAQLRGGGTIGNCADDSNSSQRPHSHAPSSFSKLQTDEAGTVVVRCQDALVMRTFPRWERSAKEAHSSKRQTVDVDLLVTRADERSTMIVRTESQEDCGGNIYDLTPQVAKTVVRHVRTSRTFAATSTVDTLTCQMSQGWGGQRCDWLIPQICRSIDLQRSGMTAYIHVGWLSVASAGLRLVSPGPALSAIRFNARS